MDIKASGEAVIKALENAGMNYFVCGLKSNSLTLSPSVSKRLCCGNAETSFASFAGELLSEDEVGGAVGMYEYILNGAETADGFFKRKDSGTHCRISMTVTEKDEDGSPVCALGIIEDGAYTEKERGEKELLESSLGLMRYTFYRIGCIDLNKNSMRSITIADSENADASRFEENFEKTICWFSDTYVLPEYRENFLNVMHPARIREIFDMGFDYIDITYRRLESGEPKWVRSELVPLKGYSPENRRVMWYVKNISEEKAAEEKLTQRLLQLNTNVNLRLETILDGISGGFKISADDEKFSYLYISESVAELFGYTVEEFEKEKQNSALENVYPPDREATLKKLGEDFAKGNTYSVKYRVQCKDGSFKWIVDNGKKIISENGDVIYYSFYQDVTELEERNARLRDTLTMVNHMLGSLSCGVLAYRLPDREVLALNEEAKRIFEIPADSEPENMGRLLSEKISPDDMKTISSIVADIKKPGDTAGYEFRVKVSEGKTLRVQASSSMLRFEDGNPYILTTMLDITEVSELTDIIKEERAEYRNALNANSEYTYSFDLTEGYITEEYVTKHGINPIRSLGLTVPVLYDEFVDKWMEQLKPQFLNEALKNEMKRETLLKKYESGEKTAEIEYYSPLTDSYTRIASLLSRSERNGHVMAVIIGTDTTQYRRNEESTKQALKEAYESARRANSAKSDFLSRMSHDIRTPMNAIIGMTAIASTHLGEKERVADCLNKINISSSYLLSLINEVLDMSKIESGRIDLKEEEFNLSELIEAMISIIRPQTKSKNQKLNIRINDIDHEKVIGDKLRIRQSFLNFISNSVKYTPDGGEISLSVTEKPSSETGVGQYEFIFEDNGIGMPPEFVEHIFEPFSRASDSRVSKIQGTGLGLAIADNLVRMMNGSIKVESELGKGSRFTVNISLKLQDSENISCEELKGLSVIVADDDAASCENVCEMLEELGMEAVYVLGGKDADKKIIEDYKNGKKYFAAIIDWKMPELDGLDTVRMIRETVDYDLPVIITSAYDWSDIEVEARSVGANAFASKPLFKSRLSHILIDILSGEISTDTSLGTEELMKENFTGKRVLLAEDNDLNAEIAQEILEMTGLSVERAENGQEAFDMFAASEDGYYNMIFMDIQMPVMSGNEASRAIRALARKDVGMIPIVAMTANAFSDDVRASAQAGMNEHIAKPLDLKQLLKSLRKWLK